jgi:hypothetical protein
MQEVSQIILQSHGNKNFMAVAQKQVDQWCRIEHSEINPNRYSHLIFDKVAKSMFWRKDSLFHK